MKIGILGTGDVGQSLGKAFVSLGHEVKMGSRAAGHEGMKTWAKETGKGASGGTFADAARFGNLIVLATRGVENANVIRQAGATHFKGKLVIDTTNPLEFSRGMPPTLARGHTDSGGEEVQRLLPGAHVVKAFNTVGHTLMFRPDLPGGPPDMFIAGNDEGAKTRTAALLKDFGWNTIDLGGIEASRYLEPMCIVWVLHGARTNTWDHAYKFLRK